MVVRIAAFVATFAGTLALITGLVYWTGHGSNLLSLHMLLGFLTVGGLWAAAFGQAVSSGGSWILAAVAVLLGALAIYVGLYQTSLIFGDLRWLIQVLHLLLGILTIGLAHMAAARVRKPRRAG